ncbi:metallophosphoesterase family protein [Photobacterium sp. TLY01]|uniref:purple acid phosphatase family protein n=1 Tax=Photobacterium sp. TLY01 TaxID=2907534 RepID=UPI001F2435ED|nr:metallophosphoesterase family protein [Photobacterium sp. TLY01]UIP29745.1 metallophosphoesterase [Photobacterium sp. TLY01]
MSIKSRNMAGIMAVLLTSTLLAGCNEGTETVQDDKSSDGGVGQIGKEVVIPPPAALAQVSFSIFPYLQQPAANSMAVLFETEDTAPTVWVRPAETQGEFTLVEPVAVDNTHLYSAAIDGLSADTRYEYYVVSSDDSPSGVSAVSERYVFKTYPSAGTAPAPFNVVAISDTQNNSTLGALNDLITKGIIPTVCHSQPEQCASEIAAITISGDIVNSGDSMLQWRRDFFDQMKTITPYVPLVAVPGNHDFYGNPELTNYRHFFQQPENGSAGYEEQWYSLDYGNLRLVGLNSYPISKNHGKFNAEILGIQRQWLRELLINTQADNNVDYVLSMFHHPCLSELWLSGESIGSCEMVAEMEDFSRSSGKITGHLFGHTHAYSRGQSMDARHLWLNAATAAGYREKINDDNYYQNDTRDYDTFAISQSEFGFNLLTFNQQSSPSMQLTRYTATVASKGGGFASLEDTFTVSDPLTMKATSAAPEAPQVLAGNGSHAFNQLNLAISHPDPGSIYEVQWQLSKASQFDSEVFDIWGNQTRAHNIWPMQDGSIQGMPTDTQAGVDLTTINLADFSGQLKMGNDETYKWQKRSSEHSHDSYRDPFNGSSAPVLTLFPGETWYWRARVRNDNLGWSDWSDTATLSIDAGTTTALALNNGGAEAQDLSGWTVEQGYWRVLQDIDNITAAEGDYYFSARPNDSAAGNAPYDDLSQTLDVSAFSSVIDQSSAFVRLSFNSNGWGDGDHAVMTLQPLDNHGNALGQPTVVKTESKKQQWLSNTSTLLLPVATREMKLTLRAVKKAGSMADVHIDHVQLSLTTP